MAGELSKPRLQNASRISPLKVYIIIADKLWLTLYTH